MPFPIRNPRDLLTKAEREIDRLAAESNGDFGEPHPIAVADLAYNVACTLWHVTDWIGNSRDPAVAKVVPDRIKKTGRERTDSFQQQLRSESDELEICWALALHFKHFELEEDSKARGIIENDVAYTSAPTLWGDFPEGAPTMSNAAPPVDMSTMGTVSVAEPGKSTLHAKVTSDGKRLRLTDVYATAYKYLDRLLNKHGV
jgi:hypothetical protein